MKHLSDHTRKCPICGKLFWPPDLDTYVFKRTQQRSIVYYCSWHCLREYEAHHVDGRKARHRKEDNE